MSISINQTEPLMPGFEDLTPMVSWLSPYVRQCGNAPRGRWKMDSRRLLDYLLVYIERGEGFFRIGSEGYRVKPGDLFWIPPGTVHYMEGTGDTMVCPYVHFDLIYRYPESHWEFSIPSGMTDLSDFAGLAHPTLPDSEFSTLSGRISIRNHHRIGEKINGICRESALAPRGHTLSLSGMMMELLAEILKDSGREESTDRYAPVMEASAAYIRSNLETALPVAELAEMHNLSEAHFRRLFTRHFSLSPGRYIRKMRMAKVKDLMTYTDCSMEDIAGLCGFADSHSLSKAFKQEEGLSPRNYRRFGRNIIYTSGRQKGYPG